MSFYLVSEPRRGRRSVEVPRYRQYRDEDNYSSASGRSSRYDDDRSDDDRGRRPHASVLVTPRPRSYETDDLHLKPALVTRPAVRHRSRSRARFRDDASIIEEESESNSDDDNAYTRSRGRTGQRPTHTLVRNRSRRRRLSDDGEPDLERKTTRRNREFRDKRAGYQNEEAAVLVRAKSRERDRNRNPDREHRRSPAASDELHRANHRSRIEISSDDDSDIDIVSRSSRRQNIFEDTSSRYSQASTRTHAAWNNHDSRHHHTAAHTRPLDADFDRYIARGDGYSRSDEKYYHRGRGLVEATQNLRT